MTEDSPFIRSHYYLMSWLRGEGDVLCYFTVTNADACHLGGSQMAGASLLITAHMKLHWTVVDSTGDGMEGGGGRQHAPGTLALGLCRRDSSLPCVCDRQRESV